MINENSTDKDKNELSYIEQKNLELQRLRLENQIVREEFEKFKLERQVRDEELEQLMHDKEALLAENKKLSEELEKVKRQKMD